MNFYNLNKVAIMVRRMQSTVWNLILPIQSAFCMLCMPLAVITALMAIPTSNTAVLVSLDEFSCEEPIGALWGETVAVIANTQAACDAESLVGVLLTTRQTLEGVANALVFDQAQAAFLEQEDVSQLTAMVANCGTLFSYPIE